MPWPMSQDYNEAIQNPVQCFTDADLKQGEAVCNALGLPVPCSGNFADVYAVQSGQRKWAVKCFTRQIPGLQERYVQISKYLKQVQLPFMVDFAFLERGIQVRGQWYPVLKMQWVEGFPFNTFVKDNLDKPQVLQTLCHIWLKLATKLREANLAHGDLQHGNVLLVPGSKAGSVGIKLVDYDGMCVSALELLKSIEVGHPAYQHPQRLKEGGYGLHIDRFSEMVIYTALRALSIGGRSIWEKFDNGDNLLFKQLDFEAPGVSAVFQELQKSPDAEVRKLTAALAAAAGKPIPQVPLLEDLVEMPKPATKVQAAAPAVTKPAAATRRSAQDVFAAATGDPGLASDRRRSKHLPRKKSFAGVVMGAGLAAAVLIGGVVLFATMSNSTPTKNEAVAEVHKTQPSQPFSQPINVVTRPTIRERPETKPQTRPDSKTEPKTDPESPLPVGELRQFAGNPAGERVVILTPDGQRVIAGDKDGTLRVWNVRTGEKLLQLKAHDGGFGALMFWRDPQHVLSSSTDGTIRLWDLTAGKEDHLVGRNSDWCRDLQLTADGKYLLSASGGPGTDFSIRQWDVTAGKEIATIGKHRRPVVSIAPLPDGKSVLAGYDGGAMILWDLKTGKDLLHFSGHRGHIYKVLVTADGRWALSASGDRTIRLWEVSTSKEVHQFTGHTDDVKSLALSPDEHRLLSGDQQGTIRLWDLAGRQELQRFTGHTGNVHCVMFSSDGRLAASASWDGTVRLWGLPTVKKP